MNLYKKLVSREEKIALVGLGYVGMPIAVAFAKKGLSVIGFDMNEEKGIVHERTGELGFAASQVLNLDFMSTHSDSYHRLKNNPSFSRLSDC